MTDLEWALAYAAVDRDGKEAMCRAIEGPHEACAAKAPRVLAAEVAALREQLRPGVCEWTGDHDPDFCDGWDTFIEGGPTENKMRFCPYCGKRLVEIVCVPSASPSEADDG